MRYRFDPELAPVVPLLPAFDLDDVAAARAQLAELVASFAADVDTSSLQVEDRQAPGADGAPPVPVRVYRPLGAPGAIPAVLYLHGGGFVLGSVETEDAAAVDLARALGVVVVSVEYRLAPEDPFPAGLEDCYAALVWLHESAAELGVDGDRIAVVGRSAGGGLAAALALLTRDRDGPALCFQCLAIPELDDRLDTPSMQAFVDTPLWNRRLAEASWRHYLGDDRSDVSPYAAPARATDLSGLPPAYLSTMEFDPLRDEGIAYANALMHAGVPVELHTFPGTFHGSVVIANAAVSRRCREEELHAIRRGLGLPV
jgi:acetyl esterase